MWAGGTLNHYAPFAPGETVTREITIKDVARKTGSTGALAFVKVRHLWSVEGAVRIDEIQNIVYREDPKSTARPAQPEHAEEWPDARSWEMTPDSVLLFRYSALTFNGHRIHYDYPYATRIEGYKGLVVHGPLQAVWMLNLAADILGRPPGVFTYRGIAPLICGTPVRVEARFDDFRIHLRVRLADETVTMRAWAQLEL